MIDEWGQLHFVVGVGTSVPLQSAASSTTTTQTQTPIERPKIFVQKGGNGTMDSNKEKNGGTGSSNTNGKVGNGISHNNGWHKRPQQKEALSRKRRRRKLQRKHKKNNVAPLAQWHLPLGHFSILNNLCSRMPIMLLLLLLIALASMGANCQSEVQPLLSTELPPEQMLLPLQLTTTTMAPGTTGKTTTITIGECTYHRELSAGNNNDDDDGEDGTTDPYVQHSFHPRFRRLECHSLRSLWQVVAMDVGGNGTVEEWRKQMRHAVEELHLECGAENNNNNTTNGNGTADAIGDVQLIERMRIEFRQLRHLSVHNCAKPIAMQFAGLDRLERLNLSGNGLIHLRWQQIGSDQLRWLDLRGNNGLRECNRQCANAWMMPPRGEEGTTTTTTISKWPIRSLFPTIPARVLINDNGNAKSENCGISATHCPVEYANISISRVLSSAPSNAIQHQQQLQLGAQLELECHFGTANSLQMLLNQNKNNKSGTLAALSSTTFASSPGMAAIFVWPLNDQQQQQQNAVAADFDSSGNDSALANTTTTTMATSNGITVELLPTQNAARLRIPALRSAHLGPVACRCLHCARPVFDTVELRFPVPLTVLIPLGQPAGEQHLIVHGYPMGGDDARRQPIRLRITRLRDNRTERHDVFEDGRSEEEEEEDVDGMMIDRDQQHHQNSRARLFFNGTLAVRPEPGHAQYFLRYFTLAVHECSQCAHAQGDEQYRFVVCMPATTGGNGTNGTATHSTMVMGNKNGTNLFADESDVAAADDANAWECAPPVEHRVQAPTHTVSKQKNVLAYPNGNKNTTQNNNNHTTATTTAPLVAAFVHVLIALPLVVLSMALLSLGARAAWRLRQRIAIREKLKRKSDRRISRNTQRTEETTIPLDTMSRSLSLSTYAASHSQQYQHVPLIDARELQLNERIGKGAFGEVFAAVLRQPTDTSIDGNGMGNGSVEQDRQPMLSDNSANNNNKNAEQKVVAVKMLSNVQMDADMNREAALLARLEHPNVLRMFGLTNCGGQVALVLELMNLGDLRNYLRNRKPRCNNYAQFPPALLPTELINICCQICDGLCYLTSQQIVHRDLAARNCLISGDTDMRCCSPAFRPPISVKIADFGMSRRLYASAEYYRMQDKRTALPVRWMPPECLNSGKFTPQSDIWSFGVLLFEVFSYGAMPFAALSNGEVLTAVMGGMCPEVPDKCPPALAELMRECWHRSPAKRISAEQAMQRLQQCQNGGGGGGGAVEGVNPTAAATALTMPMA